jgi:hypothetical protein
LRIEPTASLPQTTNSEKSASTLLEALPLDSSELTRYVLGSLVRMTFEDAVVNRCHSEITSCLIDNNVEKLTAILSLLTSIGIHQQALQTLRRNIKDELIAPLKGQQDTAAEQIECLQALAEFCKAGEGAQETKRKRQRSQTDNDKRANTDYDERPKKVARGNHTTA